MQIIANFCHGTWPVPEAPNLLFEVGRGGGGLIPVRVEGFLIFNLNRTIRVSVLPLCKGSVTGKVDLSISSLRRLELGDIPVAWTSQM